MKTLDHGLADKVLAVSTSLTIVAGVWAYTETADSYLIVPLSDMLSQFRDTWLSDRFFSDLLPTLGRMFAGYLVAIILGVGVGLAVGLNHILHALAHPLVSFLRSIPPVALLPAALVLLGIGDQMRVALIAFVCVWPILLNVSDGVAELDTTMVATGRAYGLTGWRRMRYIVFPAVSPRVFTGMRTSLSFAVIMAITSEMVAATNGVGTYLVRAQQAFQMPDMWATIILIGLLGFALNHLFGIFERIVLKWHFSANADHR